MTTQELTVFRGLEIKDHELDEKEEIAHHVLLEKAFTALVKELDLNGNTDTLRRLRAKYSQKLLAFWQNKLHQFSPGQQRGEIKLGNNTLSVSQLGVYESGDEGILFLKLAGKEEECEFSVSASLSSGIDEFVSPPKIISKIKTDPDEPADIYYEITFGSNRFLTENSPFMIVRFERKKYYLDPEFKHPTVTEERTIIFPPIDING